MTLSVDIRDVEGTSTGSVNLDESVFGIEPNVPVLHQVVTAQLAAARSGTQSTKTRAEVSGGGKKPFKQKGTGRARQGSERAPHFKGGGVALGPKPRSYRQRTPRKMIQLALRSALSDRAADGRVAVVRDWPWETPSTKEARGALETLGLEGKVLVVLDRKQAEAYKSFRNLSGIQLILQGELNAYDILCNDWIVFTPDTLPGESAVVDSPTGVEDGGGTSAATDADADEAEAETGSLRDDVDRVESAAAADDGAEAAAEDEPEGSVAGDATAVDDDEEETGDE